MAVPTENFIQSSDTCAYKNYLLILSTSIPNSDFVIILLYYGALPSSPSPCMILFCASPRTDGGHPSTSPATCNSQRRRQKAFPHSQVSHHPILIPKLSKNFVGFSLPIRAKM